MIVKVVEVPSNTVIINPPPVYKIQVKGLYPTTVVTQNANVTSGTAEPSGGEDGDIYLQYTP